jgi:hypothetical protein
MVLFSVFLGSDDFSVKSFFRAVQVPFQTII